jgi:hypothetical protein
MTKEELIGLLLNILKTDISLHFLSKLQMEELETLIECIRDRIEKEKGWPPSSGG